MARIRSIHPGLFTDDKYMALSPHAALLLIGIWTECDDQGVFQWRPLTLKARILPAANTDVGALLAELAEEGFVAGFEENETMFGMVRNFRKFQRPQKPTAIHPLPERYRKFVGLDAITTVPVQEPYDTPPVNPPQMEEVIVGKEEKEERVEVASPNGSPPEVDLEPPEFLDRRRKGTRLPADWTLSDEWRAAAEEARSRNNLPSISLDLEAEKFGLYWRSKPGAGGTKLDWKATWISWILKSEGPRNGARNDKSADYRNGYAQLLVEDQV